MSWNNKIMFHHSVHSKATSTTSSAAQHIAYIIREQIYDEYFGEKTNVDLSFEQKKELQFCQIFGPDFMNPNLKNPQEFSNFINRESKGFKNKAIYGEAEEIGLPNKFSKQDCIEVLKKIGNYYADDDQVCLITLHMKPGNTHAHILKADSKLDKSGNKLIPKSHRMWVCENTDGEIKYFRSVKDIPKEFERIPERDINGNIKKEKKSKNAKNPSIIYKRIKVDDTGWHHQYESKEKREQLKAEGKTAVAKWRAFSSKTIQEKCIEKGLDPKPWTHKSYEAIGSFRTPTKHLGPKICAIENQEKIRCKQNNEVYVPITGLGRFNYIAKIKTKIKAQIILTKITNRKIRLQNYAAQFANNNKNSFSSLRKLNDALQEYVNPQLRENSFMEKVKELSTKVWMPIQTKIRQTATQNITPKTQPSVNHKQKIKSSILPVQPKSYKKGGVNHERKLSQRNI